MNIRNQDPLLTSEQAAEYIGIKVNTLAIWRMQRRPGSPAFVRVGSHVRYRQSELERWIKSQTVEYATR